MSTNELNSGDHSPNSLVSSTSPPSVARSYHTASAFVPREVRRSADAGIGGWIRSSQSRPPRSASRRAFFCLRESSCSWSRAHMFCSSAAVNGSKARFVMNFSFTRCRGRRWGR